MYVYVYIKTVTRDGMCLCRRGHAPAQCRPM